MEKSRSRFLTAFVISCVIILIALPFFISIPFNDKLKDDDDKLRKMVIDNDQKKIQIEYKQTQPTQLTQQNVDYGDSGAVNKASDIEQNPLFSKQQDKSSSDISKRERILLRSNQDTGVNIQNNSILQKERKKQAQQNTESISDDKYDHGSDIDTEDDSTKNNQYKHEQKKKKNTSTQNTISIIDLDRDINESKKAVLTSEKKKEKTYKLWTVQVGSFSDTKKAIKMIDKLKDMKYDVNTMISTNADGETVTKIIIGKYQNRKIASETSDKFSIKFGYKCIPIMYTNVTPISIDDK